MINFFKLILVFFILSSCNKSKNYYVSTTGNDSNEGTKELPFATIERARDEVRAYNKEYPNKNITVFIRGGKYLLTKSLEFNESDSGTETSPIIYKSFENEKVFIQGGINLSATNIKKVEDKTIYSLLNKNSRDRIRYIDLKQLGILDYGVLKPRGFRRPYAPMPMELFIDNFAMRLSRWPNNNNVLIDKVIEKGSVPRYGDYSNKGGVFTYKSDANKNWKLTNDLWISGFFYYGFADDAVKVKSIDTNKKLLATNQATMYGYGAGVDYRAFYFYNLLEELDIEGEYYLDRDQGKLYFIPPFDKKVGNIQLSMLEEPMVTFEESSYIQIKNITFENTRGIGVYIEGGESIKLDSCTLRNIGIVAVCVGKGIEPFKDLKHNGTGIPRSRILGSWNEHIYDNSVFDRNGGKNHGIVNCEIYNIGSGAISLGGGNRKNLIPANNYVKNCKIYNFNRIEKSYRAGVNIDGVGNIIENCEIFDSSGSAIYMHGNDHLIQFNNIHNTLKQADDMGAIYIGRDPSEYGNIIKYNYFHHNGNLVVGTHGTNAIHLDDISSGVTVYGNVFYKNDHVITLNGGYNNKIENNILLDNRVSPVKPVGLITSWAPKVWKNYVETETLNKRLRVDIDITKSPYAEKYPDLLALYMNPFDPIHRNIVASNVCINSGTLEFPEERKGNPHWNKLGNNLKNNYESKIDTITIDTLDFSINDERVLKQLKNFKKIPFDKIGLIK